MHVLDLQSYKAQSLPQKDLFCLKEKADPDRAKTAHSNSPPHVYVTMWKYLRNAAQMSRKERRRGFSNRSSVDAPCQGDTVCFYAKAKALYLGFRK